MTVLDTRSKDTIVGTIAAGMQSWLPTAFLNFAKGKVFRAVAEAHAGVALWLQKEIVRVAKLTRLSTSYGADVDSWLGDWGIISRIGAVAATGLVVFSRFTPSGSAPVIPVNAQVKTQDGTQVFQVYADTTNAAYSAAAYIDPASSLPVPGYIMPAQVASISVPVINITPGVTGAPGSNGNVAAGTISLVASAISGVDAVINPSALTNGIDSESDTAVKGRFPLAVAGLSKGTDPAIGAAIEALQVGLQYTIQDCVDYNGATDYGMTTVVVDDGSGAINGTLLAACQAAAFAVKAAGTRMGVYAATTTYATVAATISTLPGYIHQNVVAQVTAAVASGINSLGLGVDCQFFDVADWIKAVPGVFKLTSLTLNGGTADVPATKLSTIKYGSGSTFS